MSAFLLGVAGATGGPKVTVSGEGVSDVGAGLGYAAISFASDGTVDKTEGVTTTQVDSATDWIIPNSAASGSYEVKCTKNSGTTPSGPTLGSWHALSTTRTWSLTASPAPASASCNLTIAIRNAAGTELDSATYTLSATAV